MFARLPDTVWVRNIQYIDNGIFANTSSPQTNLTFQVNISSYLEFIFDRFVWTCRAAYANSSAPLGRVYLLWHLMWPTSRLESLIRPSSASLLFPLVSIYLSDWSEDLHTQTNPFIEGWALSSCFRERKFSDDPSTLIYQAVIWIFLWPDAFN